MCEKDKEIEELKALLVTQQGNIEGLEKTIDSMLRDNFNADAMIKDLSDKLEAANKKISVMDCCKKAHDECEFNRKLFQSDTLEMVCDVIDSEVYCPEAVARIIKGISADIIDNA